MLAPALITIVFATSFSRSNYCKTKSTRKRGSNTKARDGYGRYSACSMSTERRRRRSTSYAGLRVFYDGCPRPLAASTAEERGGSNCRLQTYH